MTPQPNDLKDQREGKPLYPNTRSPGQKMDRAQGNHLFSTLAHNLPSQETSQILLHGRQSKLLSFRVFLSVAK